METLFSLFLLSPLVVVVVSYSWGNSSFAPFQDKERKGKKFAASSSVLANRRLALPPPLEICWRECVWAIVIALLHYWRRPRRRRRPSVYTIYITTPSVSLTWPTQNSRTKSETTNDVLTSPTFPFFFFQNKLLFKSLENYRIKQIANK